MAITKIGTPELFDFSLLNTALQLPTGTTLQRPSTPSTGEWRFNTDEKYVEYWDGGAWRQIDTEALPNPDDFPTEHFNVNTYFGTDVSHKIDAKFVEAANFNGSSSLIALPDSSVISQQNNFTLSFWVKPNGFVAFGTVLTLFSDYRNYVDIRTSGILTFNATGSSVDTPSSSITDGVWQHIAITKSSTAGTVIYVNGTDVVTDASDTGNASDFTASGYPNTVGAYKLTGSASDFFPGAIDQIRIFNTALTAAQAEDLYTDETTTTAATLNFPAGAGCIAAYQLDGDASDISGTYGGVETNIGYTGLKFQADFIWIKSRNATADHTLTDSVRGVQELLSSNTTATEGNQSPNGMTNFGANSFSVTDNSGGGSGVNGAAGGANSGTPPGYVAWCWKAAASTTTIPSGTNGSNVISNVRANTASGFSIVKFGALGAANSIVSHGLSSAPEFIIYKNLITADNWYVYTSTTGLGKYLNLNLNSQAVTNASNGFTSVNANTFTVNLTTNADDTVAYCFHSVAGYQRISSYTGTGNNPGPIVYTTNDGTATGTDGFEPAMIIIKRTDSAEDWKIIDNKRGFVNSLEPNEGIHEEANNNSGFIAATNGFQINDTSGDYNANGGTYIYLAIAADKDSSVPTAANSFKTSLYTGNDSTNNIYTPFAPDFTWIKARTDTRSHTLIDTIRGATRIIQSESSGAEWDGSSYIDSFNPNGFTVKSNAAFINNSSQNYISWNWKAGGLPTINNDGTNITSIVSANQAAGFSIVKYTGIGSTASVGHGLGVAPTLILAKCLDITSAWVVYSVATGVDKFIELNDNTAATTASGYWGTSAPTASVFEVNNGNSNNNSTGNSIIAYCFANSTGYQQAGTYSGSSSSVTINFDGAGFNPSFVMIRRTNATGQLKDWTIFDQSLSGSTTMNDYLVPNSNAPEFTNSGSEVITATSTGFTIAGGVWDGLNASGGEYLYLAVK